MKNSFNSAFYLIFIAFIIVSCSKDSDIIEPSFEIANSESKEDLQDFPDNTALDISQQTALQGGPPLLNCHQPSDCSIDLVYNGDFSSGDVGFNSSLPSNQSCLYGTYWVDHSARDKCLNALWQNIIPASGTGNFMIVDGKNGIIWEQTISVTPGETYDWAFQLYPDISNSGGPTLAVKANNATISSGLTGTSDHWNEFCGSYTAPSNVSSIKLQIVQTGSSGYNDYGIDEIKLLACCNGANLVPNGNFEAGNTNFSSNLPFASYCKYQSYSVESNAKNKCNNALWDPVIASEGNLYMVVDGFGSSTPSKVVYRNNVTLPYPMSYKFSFDYYPDISNGSLPILGVYLNGTLIGQTTGLSGGTWNSYTFPYSGSGSTNIEIRQLTTGTYNDYGIDNISLACKKGSVHNLEEANSK